MIVSFVTNLSSVNVLLSKPTARGLRGCATRVIICTVTYMYCNGIIHLGNNIKHTILHQDDKVGPALPVSCDSCMGSFYWI